MCQAGCAPARLSQEYKEGMLARVLCERWCLSSQSGVRRVLEVGWVGRWVGVGGVWIAVCSCGLPLWFAPASGLHVW